MALFGKLFGKPAEAQVPAERMDVAGKAVDARLDAAQAASSKGVMARMKSLMGAVKEKTRDVLMYDVGQGAKDAATFVKNDAAATFRDAKTLGRKALEVGNADVGAYARRAAMAAGLAGAMAAPAYAEDKPADAMVVSGARVELVSAPSTDSAAQAQHVSAPSAAAIEPAAVPMADLEAAVSLARVSADKGEPVVVAMNDKPRNVRPEEGSLDFSSLDRINTPSDPAYELTRKLAGGERAVVGNPDRPLVGADALKLLLESGQVPKEFGSYFDYVRELDRLASSGNPADRAAYERLVRERGVVTINVYEGTFANAAYPDTVTDWYNGRGRNLIPATSLRLDYDFAALRSEVKSFVLANYDKPYAESQFALGNPDFAGLDGKYNPKAIEKIIEDYSSQGDRWERVLGQMDSLDVGGRKGSEVAAAAINRLHRIEASNANVPVNWTVLRNERIAALSIASVYAGVDLDENGSLIGIAPYFGKNKGMGPEGLPRGIRPDLLAGDLSTCAIAIAARDVKDFSMDHVALRSVRVLKVVRCKDPDGNLAKVLAIADESFKAVAAQVPVTNTEVHPIDQKIKALELFSFKPDDYIPNGATPARAAEIRLLAAEIRTGFKISSTLVLVDDRVKASVPAALDVLAPAGTKKRAAQDRLTQDLNAKAYASAVAEFNLAAELKYAEASEAGRKGWQEAGQAQKDLAAEKAGLAAIKEEFSATKEAVALFKKWENAPAAEKAKIAEELRPKVKTLLAAEQAKASPDPDGIALLKLIQSRVGA